MVLIRRSSLLAAGLLLLIAAPAYAARGHGGPPLALGDILGIGHAVGSVFGTIGHAVLGAFLVDVYARDELHPDDDRRDREAADPALVG
jgi:hypothetical protein